MATSRSRVRWTPQFRFTRSRLMVVALVIACAPAAVRAQDLQATTVGNGGSTTTACIDAGANSILNSTAAVDDVPNGTRMEAGPNGICNSTVSSDDVALVPVGSGSSGLAVIRTGSDGVCGVATVGGDDVRTIPVGHGRPFTVAIRRGTNGVVDSVPAGDDLATAVICAGPDNVLNTAATAPDRSVSHSDSRCLALCVQDTSNCIIPGDDPLVDTGTLQSTPHANDQLVPFVSSGPNGVVQSSATGDDTQFLAIGQGFVQPGTNGDACVHSGPNGVAESTICGNGIADLDENGPSISGPACDDGNLAANDGCGPTCVLESGWSCAGQPSLCNPICGDNVIRGNELCDDGNTSNTDACVNIGGQCKPAVCGDGFRKTGGLGANELCDDGNMVNGDGCDNNCTPSGCGNGVLNPGELCDDGNLTNGDNCDANCTPTGCGNGVRTGSEQCDDGNTSNLDACLNSCLSNSCGDGFQLVGTEACDDGNAVNGDGCDANCTLTGCGNGIPTAGEACDDGNASNTDDCLATCVLPTCGDTFRKSTAPAEQCDDGNLTSGDGCDANCTTTRCGNGIVTAPETCDDTNAVNGDGCDNNCTATACGNGIRTTGEACDDGNLADADDCRATCAVAVCGDGVLRTAGTPPFEQCEDGNVVSGDGCDANCTPTACGNGVVTSGETCDDGNVTNGDGCDINCTPTGCGNGVVTGGETCDDGNLVNDDGCDANCTPTGCGNGVKTSGEQCDDGNNRNDDTCVVGCVDARCGDGFRQRTAEECDDGCLAGIPNVCEPGIDDADESCSFDCKRLRPTRCLNGIVEAGEECDDGNHADGDDCTNDCRLAVCGDGIPHTKGTGGEQCDDGNTAYGDGCTPQCQSECGNGAIDHVCAEPESNAGNTCELDADCDSIPSAGDGRCIASEQCDPGIAGLCADDGMSPICSSACVVKVCGNGVAECDEECDFGAQNGAPGSGCTATCSRNLAEAAARRECPSAFTVDLPPQPLPAQKQTCADGGACDFDHSVNGQCVFRIGVCLNRPQAGCTADGLKTFDMLGVKIRGRCVAGDAGRKCLVDAECDTTPNAGDGNCQLDRAVEATTRLTNGVLTLAEDGKASIPGRCREGLRGKVCSVNNECDRAFGLGNGRCDIGTGVEFTEALNATDDVGAPNQPKICTDGIDIVVDAGTKLKLRSFVRRTTGPADKDRLLLVCTP